MPQTIDTQTIRIRKSARAKRLKIRIFTDYLEAVTPKGMKAEAVYAFAQEHAASILSKQTQLQNRAKQAEIIIPETICNGSQIRLLENTFTIQLSATSKSAHYNGDVLILPSLENIDAAEQQKFLKTKLQHLLKKMFLEYSHAIYEQYSQLGTASKTTLRTQTSRWGSCSSDNAISLNWWLIFAPQHVAEYVIVHELCHITYKDHSPNFWNLVAQSMPAYNKSKDWLNLYGQALQDKAAFISKG